ncbi:sensor domain-containing diguanylate cyclase [Arcobacter arenosus]|uniref:diguanylate cyclase n=1 Tax=Arcobacter arenosus TaxID=2576037 RepID=A0A5R8XZE9_9BACT|nr:cache domain-containing protein [Arcobacter arenosus]TLP37494.1 diguanylate cyclase [Arcobacter arenosus]
MKYLKHFSFTNIILFVSFFFTFSLTLLWFFEVRFSSEQIIKNYQNMQLEQRKTLLKNQVENAIDYIKYKRINAENNLKEVLKDKIYDAYHIADNLYNKFKDTKSDEEIISIIKESLREFRFFDGRGYFFILKLDGEAILHPIFPQYEGTYFLRDYKDTHGINLHNLFKYIASSKQKEGYVEYYFYRTDNKENESKKIGFIKYFEPFDLYIGTSEYLKDYEKIVQNEVLNRLNEVRYGKYEYLFINNLDGTVLMNPLNPQLVGKNMLNFKDENGLFVVKEFIKVAKEKEGGFVKYIWKKPDSNEKTTKFTYIEGFKPWDWYIGSGSHLDDIKSEIFYKALKQKEEQKNRIYIVGFLMICLTLLSLYSMIWWNRRIRKSIEEFNTFFEKSSSKKTKIDSKKILFKEFNQMAVYLNNMLESKEKLKTQLEHLAITDKLTGINNRLKIDELLQNEIVRSKRYNHAFGFAIIDIDNFKSINDNYGHQVGDSVLIKIAKILKENIRNVDYLGRWGGEEFVIICPETSLEGTLKLMEDLKKIIESESFETVGTVTASFGLTLFDLEDDASTILKRADDALYKAKDDGRNKVVVL